MEILKINLNVVNKFMLVILAFLVLITFFSIFKKVNYDKYASLDANYYSKPVKLPQVLEKFQDLTYYLNTVKSRNVFAYTLKTDDLDTVTFKQADSSYKINAVYQEGNHFESVIQDKNSKKTYFIKEGDTVNGCIVKKITSTAVILQCGSNEMELL